MIKKGEIWKVNGRKGPLTIRILEDVDPTADVFFDAEVIHGKARFMSEVYREAQRLDGYGTAGSVMPFRATLTTFVEKVGEMPIQGDEVVDRDTDPRLLAATPQ